MQNIKSSQTRPPVGDKIPRYMLLGVDCSDLEQRSAYDSGDGEASDANVQNHVTEFGIAMAEIFEMQNAFKTGKLAVPIDILQLK